MSLDIRVVRGQPSDEELAAIVSALLTKLAAAESAAPQRRSAWLHRESMLRAPLHAGPGAWRRSGLP